MNPRLIWPGWFCLGAALLLAGCHTPRADLSTVQDPKHSVNRQSKIGFPAAETLPGLNARLAGEFAQKQMTILGFTLVPPEQADFLVHAEERPHDLAVTEDPGGPSFSTGIGGSSGGGVFTGFGVGIPLGSPRTTVIHRTELDVSLETTQSPKLIVWQGKILADTKDSSEYHGPFFRALLSRAGSTFNGTIRLDKEDEVAPKP